MPKERNLSQITQAYAPHAPWILRITEYKGKPDPVFIVPAFVVTECLGFGERPCARGLIYGQSMRRCLPIIREIIGRVCDDAGVPLELHRHFNAGRIDGDVLPLDEEAGAKLALIFKLQERIKDMDRVELIALRVERFSREEAVYWLTRATQYGADANRWALAGMRVILGGQPEDKAVLQMLERLRG